MKDYLLLFFCRLFMLFMYIYLFIFIVYNVSIMTMRLFILLHVLVFIIILFFVYRHCKTDIEFCVPLLLKIFMIQKKQLKKFLKQSHWRQTNIEWVLPRYNDTFWYKLNQFFFKILFQFKKQFICFAWKKKSLISLSLLIVCCKN